MEDYYESPKVIAIVGAVLRQPIDMKAWKTQLVSLEALQFELAEATVDQMKMLYQSRKQVLWPKDFDKKLTELDRTTRLNADAAVIERDYRLLKRVQELVDSRLDLIIKLHQGS